MSTRCNIIIREGKDKILLYHHHDGYPEGVGKDLLNYMQKTCDEHRGVCAESVARELVKNETSRTGLNDNGYVPAICIHYDIEYLYEIDTDRCTLRCWSVRLDWETGRYKRRRFIDMNDYK